MSIQRSVLIQQVWRLNKSALIVRVFMIAIVSSMFFILVMNIQQVNVFFVVKYVNENCLVFLLIKKSDFFFHSY